MGKKRSIIQSDSPDYCFFCGKPYPEEHHIYFGNKNRRISDREGFTVHLCHECHKGTDGVHGKYGHLKDIYLKKTCQIAYEETHTRQEFRALIGCNYLEEDED